NRSIPASIRIPGQITGAIASSVALGPALAGASALAGAARLPGIVRAIGGGAAGGALFGSGEADPGKRLEGAAGGAGLGATVGGIAYPIIQTGAAAWRALRPQSQAAADLGRALAR